jgi:heme-degrading monooxygenase HmoA
LLRYGVVASAEQRESLFMFAVIFEVQPKAGARDSYLALATVLRPELEQIEGFIDNERFASRKAEGRVLSLSTWRDEKALIRWRTLAAHHTVQQAGRFVVFADYHLRVGEITADTRVPEGQTLEQERFDTTTAGKSRMVTITDVFPDTAAPSPESYDSAAGLVALEDYDSIATPGKTLWLASWRDESSLAHWQERYAGGSADPAIRRRTVRIIRDYGMRDRREAPQYYPPAEPVPAAPRADPGERTER